MIWLFLILALSAVSVSLVGLAAYLRVRHHMKEASPKDPQGKP
jgi:NADH:ubiquinone oxidoreductase subunit 2 (subunit N)